MGAYMKHFTKGLTVAAAGAALAAVFVVTSGGAQQGPEFLKQIDANHDGSITRDELKAAMGTWLAGKDSATQSELAKSLEASLPEAAFLTMISPPQSQTPKPEDV